MSDKKPIVFFFFLVRHLIIALRDNIHFNYKYRRVFVSRGPSRAARDLVSPLLFSLIAKWRDSQKSVSPLEEFGSQMASGEC